MLSVDKSSKRDITITDDSSSYPLPGAGENPTSIRRRTTVEQWVQTLTKRRVLLAPAAGSRLLGRSLLNIAPAIICAYQKRPKLEGEATQHIQHASGRAAVFFYPTILITWMRLVVLLSDIQ